MACLGLWYALSSCLSAEQASTSVKHMALPCHWSQRTTVTGDLVRCYGALGRTIIFCDTKRDCNELTAALGEDMRARALHGDIPQQQREVIPRLFQTVSLPSTCSWADMSLTSALATRTITVSWDHARLCLRNCNWLMEGLGKDMRSCALHRTIHSVVSAYP